MFNLQGSEIIIILLLALVVLGPEKLPDAMRKAGKFYAELRKMSTGFQEEFRAAVDEPMREIRDTANVLRDSADFTKLQEGDREEKPKSAEMAPADPDAVPSDEIPTFETDGPTVAPDSKPAPFESRSSTAPRTTTPGDSAPDDPAPTVDAEPDSGRPQPFGGRSSAAPRTTTPSDDARDGPTPDDSTPDGPTPDETNAHARTPDADRDTAASEPVSGASPVASWPEIPRKVVAPPIVEAPQADAAGDASPERPEGDLEPAGDSPPERSKHDVDPAAASVDLTANEHDQATADESSDANESAEHRTQAEPNG